MAEHTLREMYAALRDAEVNWQNREADHTETRSNDAIATLRTKVVSANRALLARLDEADAALIERQGARNYILGRNGMSPLYPDGTSRNLSALIVALEDRVRAETLSPPDPRWHEGGGKK